MLNDNLSAVTYTGDGTNKNFDFNFKVWNADDLEVFIRIDEEHDQEKVTNWTATITDDGGVVVYPTSGDALPAGHKLSIRRNMDIEQNTDFINANAVRGEALETALDKLTAMVGQVSEKADRAVVAPLGDTPVTYMNKLHDMATGAEAARDGAIVAKTASEAAKQGSEEARNESIEAKTASEAARDIAIEKAAYVETIEVHVEELKEEITEVGDQKIAGVNAAGTTQTNNVNSAGSTQVTAVNDKGDEKVALITSTATTEKDEITELGDGKKTAITNEGNLKLAAVSSEGDDQVARVITQGNTDVARVKSEGDDQVEAVGDKGTEQVAAVTTEGTTQKNLAKAQADRAEDEADRAKEEADRAAQIVAGDIDFPIILATATPDKTVLNATAKATAGDNHGMWLVGGAQAAGEADQGITIRAQVDGLPDVNGNSIPTTDTPKQNIRLEAGTLVRIISQTELLAVSVPLNDAMANYYAEQKIQALVPSMIDNKITAADINGKADARIDAKVPTMIDTKITDADIAGTATTKANERINATVPTMIDDKITAADINGKADARIDAKVPDMMDAKWVVSADEPSSPTEGMFWMKPED